MLSCVRLFVTLWTVAHYTPLSVEFSRQEHWSGLPFPSAGDLPDPGIEPRSSALQADSLLSESPGKPIHTHTNTHTHTHIYTYIQTHIHTQIRLDQISRSVMSDSLRPHESQHARPPCPSPTPGVHSDSHPLNICKN